MADVFKTLTSLTSGTLYDYRITALGDGTNYTDSDPSEASTFTTLIPLATPTGLALTKTTNSITATWNAVANATGYIVSYVTGAGTPTETTVSATTFTLSSLAQGVTYDFKVKAISSNSAYEASAYSSVVSATTLIKLSTPVPTISKTTSSITCSWSAIANATAYKVSYKQGSGSYTEVDVSSGTSYTLDSLQEGVTYTFKVKAVTTNAAYEDSEYSAEVSDETKTTLATPAPTLTKTTSSITIAWSAISNATGYVVAYKTGAGAYTEVQVSSPTYSLTGLASGVTYTFKVKATSTNDDYADTPYSSEQSETTLIKLSTPTNIVVSDVTSTSVKITWTDVANNNGYKLQYKRDADSEWIDVVIPKE